jgi:steroid 5-alpha reductase family enzyme
MLWFLLRVTGIPMTEARLLASRGEAYRAYQRSTNAFFPGRSRGDGAEAATEGLR